MKINNLKSIVVGILIGGSLMFSFQSFAAIKVEAAFAKFNILINGQVKELQTNPLVVNGTSYLPIRNMANLFGYDVTYNEVNRTIELNTPVPKSDLPVLTEDDAIFYSQVDIYLKNKEHSENPHMIISAKKGNIVAIYNNQDYYPVNNVSYFYDKDTDILYFSKTFLLQFLSIDFLNQLEKFKIDFTNKKATRY